MGYTHYVSIPNEGYEAALAAIPNVARDLRRLHGDGVLPPLAGGNGGGEPAFDDHEIVFNGVRPHHVETCYIGPTEPAPGDTEKRFLFTKTAYEPYDLAVMVAYALWWHHSDGAIKVDSDGDLDDWKPALELLEVEFGYVISVEELFDVSYARLRFDGGLEVAVELRHEARGIKKDTLDWTSTVLANLAKDRYGDNEKKLGASIMMALRKEDFPQKPVVLYYGRGPVPGFGRRRYGFILFADEKAAREGA